MAENKQCYICNMIGIRGDIKKNLGDIDHDFFENDEKALDIFFKRTTKLFHIYRYDKLICIVLRAKDRKKIGSRIISPKTDKRGYLLDDDEKPQNLYFKSNP